MADTISDGLTVIEGGKGGKGGEVVELGDRVSNITGSKQWAQKIRRRAKELSQTLDTGYLEMARLLHQVWDVSVDGDPDRGPIYTMWGHTSFGDYSEQELGIPRKKAERLRLIWHTLEIQLKDMPGDLKERIVKLGYSKVRELIRVLTLRNAESWVKLAESVSYTKLYEAIQQEKRANQLGEAALNAAAEAKAESKDESDSLEASADELLEETREVFTQKRFDLAASQLENVLLALTKAAQMSGSEKEGYLLDLICIDFIANNDTLAGDTDKRLRYIAKLERTLGLKLVAVDPEAKEIVYGIDALLKLRDEGGSE